MAAILVPGRPASAGSVKQYDPSDADAKEMT
jgi:hypothetical protein